MKSFENLEMLFILTNINRHIDYTSAIYGTLAFVNKRGLEADDREKISYLRLNRTRILVVVFSLSRKDGANGHWDDSAALQMLLSIWSFSRG